MNASPARLLRSGGGKGGGSVVERRRIETLETQSSSGSVHTHTTGATAATIGTTTLLKHQHRRRPLQRPPIEPPILVASSQDAVLLKKNVGQTTTTTNAATNAATTIPHTGNHSHQNHVSMMRRNRLGARHNSTSNATADTMSIETSSSPLTADSSTSHAAAAAVSAPLAPVRRSTAAASSNRTNSTDKSIRREKSIHAPSMAVQPRGYESTSRSNESNSNRNSNTNTNTGNSAGPLHPLRHGTGARLARSHGRSITTGSDNDDKAVVSSHAPLVSATRYDASDSRPVHKANLKADIFQKRSLQLRTAGGALSSSSRLDTAIPSTAPHAMTTTTTTSARLFGTASGSSTLPFTPATTKASNHQRYSSSNLSFRDRNDPTAQKALSNPNDPSLTATPNRDTVRLDLSTRRPDRYGAISEPSHTGSTVGPASPPRQNIQHQHLLLKHQDKVHRRRKSPTTAATNTTNTTTTSMSALSSRSFAELPQSQQQPPTTLPVLPQHHHLHQRQTPRLAAQQPPRPSPQQYPLTHHHQTQQHLPPRSSAMSMEQLSPHRPYDRYQQQENSPRLPLPPLAHSPLPVGVSPSNSSYDHPYDTSIDEGGRLVLIRREKASFQNPGQRFVESERDFSHLSHGEAAGLLRRHHPSLYERDRRTPVSHQPLDNTARIARASSSTSDYETDASRGDDDGRNPASSSSSIQQQQEQHDHQYNFSRQSDRALHPEPTFSNMSASQMTPDVAAFFDQANNTSAVSAARSVRDDDTYDYGDRDDNIVDNSNLDDDDDDDDYDDDHDDDNASQGSLSYEQRRQKMEREREARAAAAAAAKAELDGPFMQQDDVEHYRKAVDTPLGRTAAGVAVAATLGCIMLGPVGLLVGAAAVGIGAGYMQIPEEQRQNMNNKATEAAKNAQESVFQASEKLSNTCALSYRDSGIADHVPVEIDTCCTTLAGMDEDGLTNVDNDASVLDNDATGERDVNGNEIFPAGGGGGTKVSEKRKSGTPTHHASWLREKKGKVACLRKGKVIPLAQIHALDPTAQPRAWLDVLASADTTHDEKIEAIEEILIQAKDKQKSRIFVDEGILDCLLWTIERYFEKQAKGPGSDHWAHPTITSQEATAARLSATCCLTLGKSYCAAIHTEGDLLLMSLYDRGTVPEERQLAQMLLEVPHHTRSTRTDDPTIITPGKEVFTLKQMTLPQAEELAASIATLASTGTGSALF